MVLGNMLSLKEILEIEISRNFRCEFIDIKNDRGGDSNFLDVNYKYIQKDGSNLGSMSTYFRLDKDFGDEFQRLFNELKRTIHILRD